MGPVGGAKGALEPGCRSATHPPWKRGAVTGPVKKRAEGNGSRGSKGTPNAT